MNVKTLLEILLHGIGTISSSLSALWQTLRHVESVIIAKVMTWRFKQDLYQRIFSQIQHWNILKSKKENIDMMLVFMKLKHILQMMNGINCGIKMLIIILKLDWLYMRNKIWMYIFIKAKIDLILKKILKIMKEEHNKIKFIKLTMKKEWF